MLGNLAPVTSLPFQERQERYQALIAELYEKADEVKLGGGKAKIEREHARGKLTARERIAGRVFRVRVRT